MEEISTKQITGTFGQSNILLARDILVPFSRSLTNCKSSRIKRSPIQNTQRIVVTFPLPHEGQKLLNERARKYGWIIEQWEHEQIISQQTFYELLKKGSVLLLAHHIRRSNLMALLLTGVNGILCKVDLPINKEVLTYAGTSLKIVSTMSAGFDHIDVETAQTHGITVCNTPDALTDASADLTVTLVLAVARRLNEAIDAARMEKEGVWLQSWIRGMHIGGKTVGILGMGRIGLATAKRLRAFNVGRILYHGNSPRPEADEVNGEFVSLDTLLKESDILCVCCSLNNTTRNILGYNEFCAMKSSSILVNTARGGVIDQDGLVRALKENRLYGAGLDVAVPEPLPANHELLLLKNCIVVPHIASATHETRNAMAVTAVENLCAGILGKTPSCLCKSK
ncbi:D-isomer specific 2-hydroxyacid dehydrogenase [Syncephalis fuscata]|nr:D-isomer specific 2-hydroxyacid dehydrogenase [Syncephalis fuscata]